jgi:hypothetical protein
LPQSGSAAVSSVPGGRFASVNNDTLYSIAQLDLGVGPVLLRVPDAARRYYVLQFVDAWTSVVRIVGRWEHEPPADTSNWLPAPNRPVPAIMRLYQPKTAVPDGSYQTPPSRRPLTDYCRMVPTPLFAAHGSYC